MTPDELITRIFKLQAELNATKTAQEALMVALPDQQQELWMTALRTLAASQAATLSTPGVGTTGAQGQIEAVQRRIEHLERVRKAFVKAS